MLLRAGISRDARTKVDRTPLHVAAQAGHLDIVSLLVRNGADIDARDMVTVFKLIESCCNWSLVIFVTATMESFIVLATNDSSSLGCGEGKRKLYPVSTPKRRRMCLPK